VIGVISHQTLERIEIFSRWQGFADPPSQSAKLTITACDDRFLREQALAGSPEELPAATISDFLAALSRDPIPQLDPALFNVPEPALLAHYGSVWTDDYPSHLIRVTFATGRVVTLRAEAQHAFMLPLRITDETGAESVTFNPRLSEAIAALMPEGYPDRDRLAGRFGLLQWDIEECIRKEAQRVEVPDTPLTAGSEEPTNNYDAQSAMEEIYRILRREESPAERLEAERTGRLSERLLLRNSLEEVRDLLARGANPSIADDHGQTALMLAASPPVDREKFWLLVSAGAEVDARRYDGSTGLHLACAGGMADAVEEWIQAGADIHARTPEGATPLMLGASWLEVVRTLLAAGADVNAADQDGHTPLVYAVLKPYWLSAEDHLAAIRVLLGAGADVNRGDKDGTTPVGHARQMLARAKLQEEVCREFNQGGEASHRINREGLQMAESVWQLLFKLQ
jgi:hypothetical protein